MLERLDPKVDVVFKRVFGAEAEFVAEITGLPLETIQKLKAE